MVTKVLTIDGNWLSRVPWECAKHESDAVDKTVSSFVGSLDFIEGKFEPETTIIAWDSPPSEYIGRRRLIPGYKANRKPVEPGYFDALRQLKKVVKGRGAYQFSGPGEGDDVIASVVRTMPGPHTIYSVDKDLFQLVNPEVQFYRATQGGLLYTYENIKEETGLTADEWTEYLSLMGDASDNLKGVPGIGDVWARKIIAAYPGIVFKLTGADTRQKVVEDTELCTDKELKKKILHCAEHHRDLTETWLAVTLQTIRLAVTMPEGQ